MSKRANGEGTIYKRSDGRWVASVSLDRGKRKAFYGKTRQEVHNKLMAAQKALQEGLPLPAERQPLAGFLDTWLATVKPSVRPRTYEAYDLNVRRIAPHLGHVKLARLSPAHVQSTYNALLEGGLSRRSVEQAHAVLHRALRQAVLWGLAGRNPTEAVNVPRPGRKEMRTLDQEQVRALFTTTSADRLHALWVLLVTTGLRIGEALGLRWDDIDLEGKRLTVRRALQRQIGIGLTFVEPKTSQSRRTIHLASETASALQEHRRQQLEERLAVGPDWEDQGLVFCQGIGHPIDPSTVSRALWSALDRAGLPRIRVHDLRHTSASFLLAQGVHPKVVQEMLGHSTITLTLDTYSHVSPALHRDVAERMGALFGAG